MDFKNYAKETGQTHSSNINNDGTRRLIPSQSNFGTWSTLTNHKFVLDLIPITNKGEAHADIIPVIASQLHEVITKWPGNVASDQYGVILGIDGFVNSVGVGSQSVKYINQWIATTMVGLQTLNFLEKVHV